MKCLNCDNSGTIWASRIEETDSERPVEYTFAFRCTCTFGRARPEVGIPLYDSERHKGYLIHPPGAVQKREGR